MKTGRTLLLLAALAAAHYPAPVVAQQPQVRRYKIYCVEGAVRVEKLTMDELREEFKGPVCELARTGFESMSVARRAAKRFGGVGAPCRCAEARKAA
ncbi:MAG TPA: hypothetical protein VF240_16000 [Pyrinomonadaceae bacterium]